MEVAEPQTDIASLWEQALNEYQDVAKVDIRAALSAQKSITSIMMEQQHQLDNFKVFRHDKGKLDKFRSLISSNADIIQGVAKHVSDAASAAFPPSSAILTAFTYVMNASKSVSEDYDMIEGFFGVMQSFLQRLSLLEHKIPPQPAFQKFVMNVFSSLLKLSALARLYCNKGRFSKWAKALVEGKDPELSAAYSSLDKNIQRLESATIIQTLRTAIEISEMAKSTDKKIMGLQGQMERSHAIQVQTLETGQQTLMVASRVESGVQELVVQGRDTAQTSNEMLRRQDEMMRTLDKMRAAESKDKNRNLKAGVSKPMNYNRLRVPLLENPAEGGLNERLKDLRFTYVDRLFEWIEEDPALESISNNQERLLWVNGTAGMGKSQVAFQMYNSLSESFAHDMTTSVAWFAFDEDHPEMRSILNMLKCCALRAAEKDEHYCAEALMALRQKDNLSMDEAFLYLIEERFTKDSNRRLIVVLDGIDEIEKDEVPMLLKYLDKLKDKECKVQVIFTSDPGMEESVASLQPKSLTLTREKLSKDMQKFAWSRTRTLSRLRKLRTQFRKLIVGKVVSKADSFLYIDHTMRRFNALGREGSIRKELEHLPPNTLALYDMLLEECQKNRTPEDRELLRNLLAWLAYTKIKFTVGEANLLIGIINKDNAISVEEELEGRLARLLRISGDRAANDNDDSSENEEMIEQLVEDEIGGKDNSEDAINFLSFQERSLRAYFREAIQDRPDSLRCSATEAQVIIFRTCATILTTISKDQTPAAQRLVEYAAMWALFHLVEIQADDDSKVTEEQTRIVIESIFDIFSNKNDALKPLEFRFTLFLGKGEELPNDYDVSQKKVLATLSTWAKRATRLPQHQLPYGILDWFRPLVQEPLRVCIHISRSHIQNWFSSTNIVTAHRAFWHAHTALKEGRNLPELRQNPNLGGYFDEYEKGGEQFTERSYEVVASAFWDIVKTSSSYQGIGMAMKTMELYAPAVKQLDKGLADISLDDHQKFHLLGSKGNTLVTLGQKEEDPEKKAQYLQNGMNTLQEANLIFTTLDEITQANKSETVHVGYNLTYLAVAAVYMGKYDLTYKYIVELKAMKHIPIPDSILKIIETLKDNEQWKTILEIYKVLDNQDIIFHQLLCEGCVPVQEAAKRMNEGQYFLNVVEGMKKPIETLASGVFAPYKINVQFLGAEFAHEVLCDVELATNLYREIVDDTKTPAFSVLEGCNRLAEIYLDNFRLTKDPLLKKAALDQTRELIEKLNQVVPEFKAAESHIILTLSLMLRRLGPSLEYSDRLHAAYRDCIENLQDDTGVNDADALRRLARVLGSVPGFERDASISLTLQFYILDEDIHLKDKELERRESETQDTAEDAAQETDAEVEETPAEVEHDGPTAAPSIDALMNGSTTTSAPEVAKDQAITNSENASAKISEMDEGVLPDQWCECDMCGKAIHNVSNGGVYFCMYCIDCDLCEECYQKKLAREKGELEADWRVICPQGHRHIYTPVEGWRGVKAGVMRIGTEEIPFKSWLAQLEIKWAKYWDQFWTDTETL